MVISRRTFLAAASLPLVAASSRYLSADVQLGSATLQTVSDGHLQIAGSVQFESMPSEELPAVLAEHKIDAETLRPECNLALYRDGVNTVIFDAGSGPNFMPSAGKISDSLDALGIALEDITHVVFTHAHPDHIWGLLDDFDEPLFSNATHMMGRVEWDFWWNPDTVNRISEFRQPFAVGAKRRMEVIEDSVVLFDPEQEILPGIYSLATYGHSPGHMSFEVGSGSESVVIIGDAINNHHVGFNKPQWLSGADQNQQMGAATRVKLLQRLAQEKQTVLGFHFPQGGVGRVEKNGDAWRLVQA